MVYAPQTPWVFPATIRQNILFGNHYDQQWYSEVIEAVGLSQVQPSQIEGLQLHVRYLLEGNHLLKQPRDTVKQAILNSSLLLM